MLNVLILGVAWLSVSPDVTSGHERNPVYAEILAKGFTAGGRTESLPQAMFRDGQSAREQHQALRTITGSEAAVAAFLRDSVTAPFILKLRDEKAEGLTIRAGDLFFALRVDPRTIEPTELFRTRDTASIEAGNMRFQAHVLEAADLQGGTVKPPGEGEWFVHTTGLLLDRIAVEATTRLTSSRSGESLVVASKTDHRFDGDDRWPNAWKTLSRRGAGKNSEPAKPYAGGAGYVKVSRLEGTPGAAVAEVHFAFAEPHAWFDGNPTLRSKFSMIAQDQIRRLRREIADRTKRKPPASN